MNVDLNTIAWILRRMPNTFIQCKLDELIVAHFVEDLHLEGEERVEFLRRALSDDHYRELLAGQSPTFNSPYSSFARREYHQCKECRAKYLTAEQLTAHLCKPIKPIVKPSIGRDAIDFNSIE